MTSQHTLRTAADVLRVLQTPQPEAGLARHLLVTQASIDALLEALPLASSDTMQESICYVLGLRKSKRAITALLALLDSSSVGLRSVAAESLAKIGDKRVAGAVLKHYVAEPDLSVKRTYAVTLGALKSHQAAPLLLEDLVSKDASLRGSVAWALGVIGDKAVTPHLKYALGGETSSYARSRIQEALIVLGA